MDFSLDPNQRPFQKVPIVGSQMPLVTAQDRSGGFATIAKNQGTRGLAPALSRIEF